MKNIFFILVSIILLVSCSKSSNLNVSDVGFKEWEEEQVYEYLKKVYTYTQDAYTKDFVNKEEAQNYYQAYFSETLSQEIVNFLFEETEEGLKLNEGLDGGYLFGVYENSDDSEITITIEEDLIHYKAVFKIGLYSIIEYTIENKKNPIITEWIFR